MSVAMADVHPSDCPDDCSGVQFVCLVGDENALQNLTAPLVPMQYRSADGD
jgi:hypothetical protein